MAWNGRRCFFKALTICDQVRTRSHQNRDGSTRRVMDQLNDTPRLILRIREGLHHDERHARRCSRHAGRIRDRAGLDVVLAGQNRRKRAIHPLDQLGPRSEVHAECERLESNCAQALLPGFQKQTDVGLAETIDRLHGIAHQKQSAAVARLPARGQLFEQLELA